MKENLHGGLSLPEYWENSREQIADVRRWGTIIKKTSVDDVETHCMRNREGYINRCNRNMQILAQFLPDKPMDELSAFELLWALQKSRNINGKTYAESTMKTRLSLLRDIYGFAEDRGDASNDLSYINDKRLEWYLNGIALPPQKRKAHFRQLAEESRTELRSLTPQQQAALVRLILDHIEEDGRYLALAILLYTGMRPSECRGLNWYDLVPFRSHPERNMLPVVRQRDNQNNLVDRLKRPASYRKIGVHFELDEIIGRRKSFIEKQLGECEDIASYPMCCFENDFKRGCSSAQLSAFAAKILRKVIQVSESVITLCAVDMLAYEDGIEGDGEDVKVSTYLLRHDFWTWLQASAELSEEEKRYFFGHSILNGWVDRRPLFNNEDWIWDMLLKLDHTIKYLPLHESRLQGALGMNSQITATNMGIYTLHVQPEVLREGGRVTIVLEANEYDDPIVVKTLTPTKNIFVSKPMKLRATLAPCAREKTYRIQKNMDYDNWLMRRHTRPTSGKEDGEPTVDDEELKQ